jgi:diphthine-ammonia ligase
MTGTALVSGGKDSIYAAYLAETQGRPVDELVTVRPSDPDSRLFHTPNLELVALQARAWGKAHRSIRVSGPSDAEEFAALESAVRGPPGWVVAGAIESSFQWARVVRAAESAGRRVYVPLWRKAPRRVVAEEIAAGLDIRFVHLAAEGLPSSLLGTRLDPERLRWLEERSHVRAAVHPAGEGGEFETLVLDAPFFAARLVLDEVEKEVGASTARLRVRKAHLEPKPSSARGDR